MTQSPVNLGGGTRLFQGFRRLFAAGVVLALAGCQNPPSPLPTASLTQTDTHLDPKTLTFRHPGTGHLFTLHLGNELNHDTGGVTERPKNVHYGLRDPTSSYYEPTDKDGAGYACAESLYSHDYADGDLFARNTTVQYQPDSRRLLITEDKSDGRPRRRYILYSPTGLGYTVTYLAPGSIKISEGPIDIVPADVQLLPGDHALVGGKTVRVADIPQSVHPFSLGD